MFSSITSRPPDDVIENVGLDLEEFHRTVSADILLPISLSL